MASAAEEGAAAARGRILVVDDSGLNQRVTVLMLRRLGYESEPAPGGREAVAAVEHGGFDAVLMDCEMPGMDGFAASTRIREIEAGKRRIPIIALTAHGRYNEREKCMQAGMDDFLAKPVQIPELEEKLARWVKPKA